MAEARHAAALAGLTLEAYLAEALEVALATYRCTHGTDRAPDADPVGEASADGPDAPVPIPGCEAA